MVVEKRKRQTAQSKSKSNARKIFLATLGAGVAAGAGYLAWDFYRKRRNQQQQLPDTIIINNQLPETPSGSPSYVAGDSFPLKQGSRGTRVAQLQEALDRILGSGTMRRLYGGIDGIFGPGTARALKAAGYGEVIDQSTFEKIISGSGAAQAASSFNAQEIALKLFDYARKKSLYGLLLQLKRINSPSEYSAVNEHYKQRTVVSKTIVTDLLNYAFKYDENAKQQIRNEFLRMGLKVDSSGRWSLEGLYQDIITLRETYVIDRLHNRIPVPGNTILGNPIKVANGTTWFRSIDNSILQVPTQDVKST